VYINITHNNKKITATPVLFYNKAGVGGFFSKLHIQFIAVKPDDNDNFVCCEDSKYETNDPLRYELIKISDIADFFTQNGESHYYFHPDEILATRFEKMISQWETTQDDKFCNMMRKFMCDIKVMESK
jgi:hypothetical protein